MIRLIVNADDFGLHPLVNEGIINGFQNGIIRSTSLLGGSDYFNEAVTLASENKGLGIGIHTTLVGSLKPVLPVSEVPSLVTSEGVFPESHTEFIKRVYTGRVNFNEVYAELDAQFAKVMDSGLSITHVDGHQHMHVLPPVLDIVLALMRKYNLRKLRIPNEKITFMNGVHSPVRVIGRTGLSHVASNAEIKCRKFLISSPRYFWGMINGGNLCEERLLKILHEVNKHTGVHEIMTHPGLDTKELSTLFTWGYHWDDELKAMCSSSVNEYIQEHNIQLINYSDL